GPWTRPIVQGLRKSAMRRLLSGTVKEVSMLTLKHIGAAAIASIIATAIVIDTADARRAGGVGGGGMRAGGIGGGGMRAGGIAGGGAGRARGDYKGRADAG